MGAELRSFKKPADIGFELQNPSHIQSECHLIVMIESTAEAILDMIDTKS